ncbi:MAG: glycine betaine ABC transporter substrate-binding protein [Synechococcales bacterium]|nr:glycine betaine ABC transporter substrate-binding protein [Synechococcales bacterium]
MQSLRRFVFLPLLSLVAALVVVSCAGGGGDEGVIRVGSKDFTEQFIIGEMYALLLENADYPVERKLNLGGTPVAQAGLVNGEIDLYPEYTGTGLLTVLKQPVSSDRDQVYQTVSDAYQEQFNLAWLEPAPMNNTQALAVTQETAETYSLRTISDMAAQADQLVMIGPPEFAEREDGLPGLQAAYGDFTLKEYKAVDTGLRYKGLVDGEADVAVAFGTDGEISAYDLVVLEDDQNLFPPYQVAPVVRQEVLDANPELADVLNQLAPLLTDETMRQLNYEVSGNQREPAEVAQEFLAEQGLI